MAFTLRLYCSFSLFALFVLAVGVLAQDPAPNSHWCTFPSGYQLESGSELKCSFANSPTSPLSPLDFNSCNLSSPLTSEQSTCLIAAASLLCQFSCQQYNNRSLFSMGYCMNVTSLCGIFASYPNCPFAPSIDPGSYYSILLTSTCDDNSGKYPILTSPLLAPDAIAILADFSSLPTVTSSPTVTSTPTLEPAVIPPTFIDSGIPNPEDDYCIYPNPYVVVEKFEDFCSGINHMNSTDSENDQSQVQQALASFSSCGEVVTKGALDCIALVWDTLCQSLCHRKNVSRVPYGYDPMIFPRSRCDEIDSQCATFTNRDCFFSPGNRIIIGMKAGACEGGFYTFGAPANTDPGFPFVKGNSTKLLTLLLERKGNSTATLASPDSSNVPIGSGGSDSVSREKSVLVGKKPWWYYFVIILMVGLVSAAAIFAGLMYKKRLIDEPELEELVSQ